MGGCALCKLYNTGPSMHGLVSSDKVAHPHSVDEADDANGDEDDGDGEEDQGDDTLGQYRLARAKLLLSDFFVCSSAARDQA